MKSAIRNGELINENQALVPVNIREVFFNFSVYESVKVLSRCAVFLEDHVERLFESAHRLGIPHSFTMGQLEEMIHRLITTDGIREAALKIQLIGGNSPLLFIFYTDLPSYPAEHYRDGVRVTTYEGERVIPEVKSTSLLLNYVALREANDQGAFEALLVDRWGCSIEGTRTNVFALSGHTLITAGAGVLSGVTRKQIIESAQRLGLQVDFTALQVKDIKRGMYDEVFLSSTSMGAMPISHVDSIRVGSSFSITQNIHTLVRKLEAAYVKSQMKRRK